MLSAPELDGQCEEHWPSVFGYDGREILYQAIFQLERVDSTYWRLRYLRCLRLFLFYILSKGCNNQAYGLHLAYLEWIRSRWRYILLHVFQQGPGVYKEEKYVMQLSYLGFI